MKVIIEYDPVTGQLSDKNGVMIATWMGLQADDAAVVGTAVDTEKLVKLKNAGFTADELVELRRKELI